MSKEKIKVKDRKDKKKVLITMGVIALATLCAVLFVVLAFFRNDEVPTFAFSGCVYADGECLAGAKVSCGVKQTETDENGYYSFDGLTSVVEVSVTKDNYIFGKGLVYVNSDRENVDFFGYELFSREGVVRNGDQAVPYVTIRAVSEAGIYTTQTGPQGTFYLPKLAGNVVVTSYSDSDIDFFELNFDKTRTDDLVVTTTTNISVSVVCDSRIDADFELSINGENVVLDENLCFSTDNVVPNSTITLTSNNYYIDNSHIRVTLQNGEYIFNAEKFYNIQGVVLSGSTPLTDARVVAGGKRADVDESGVFEIEHLHGNNIVKAYCRGFSFENVNVNHESSTLTFNGSFAITGKVATDNGESKGFVVVSGDNIARTDITGAFTLTNLKIGDVVSVDTDEYYVVGGEVILDKIISPIFELKKIYTASISAKYLGEVLDGVIARIGSNSYTSNNGVITINGLWGNNEITLECDGYRFEGEYILNHRNNTLNENDLTIYKYYNLSGVVSSGDIKIANATIQAGGLSASTDENGCFEITNLYAIGEMEISAEGYNSKVLDYSINNCEKTITLDYNVTGEISCGEYAVDGVLISCGDQSVTSVGGQFELSGLVGENTIAFSKDYYTFSSASIQVDRSGDIEISSSYKVVGKVSDKHGPLSNVTVKIAKGSEYSNVTTTNENGEYEFAGLEGKYILYCYSEGDDIVLQPSSYSDVTTGGIYNFSDSGYKIQGKVTSGDLPVAGVTVRAGDLTAVTNAKGEYKFDLLIKEETLVLSKDGYTFANNNFDVDSSYEASDVNFQCTYAISGVVASGTTCLEGVKVSIAGNNYFTNAEGYYSISGLSGSNNITLAFKEYYFDNPNSISIAGVYNVSAKFVSTIAIKTGDVPVVGAELSFAGEDYVTGEDGTAQISGLSIGDTLAFELAGYDISSYTYCDLENSVEIGATYSIAGTVYLTNSTLGGVDIKCGDMTITTDNDGTFAFSGISGVVILSFEKSGLGLNFDNITIAGYSSDLTIKAKYTVSGKVTCAGRGVEGVEILAIPTTGDGERVSTMTDLDGKYTIILDYSAVLQLQKIGYEFNDDYEVSAPCNMDIVAQFKIRGKVISGNIAVKDASILLSDGSTTITDKNGEFAFEHIEEGVSLTVSANGFNDGEYDTVYGYLDNIVIDLTYNVTINLSNITSLPAVTIIIGDSEESFDIIGTQLLENLKGSKTIKIQKDGYTFSPSQFAVDGGKSMTVLVKKQFAISGYITTKDGGLKASGVTITAGEDRSCITDSNGYYYLDGLIDTPTIRLELNVVDTAYQGENYSYSQILYTASTDRDGDNFTVPDNNYAYFLFKNGYQKLNNASSYQIFGSGSVGVNAPLGITSSQSVSIVYKKDTKGNRIIQNLNYGDKIAGVDPKVAQLTFVDTSSQTVKYQTIRGDNVKQNTANWTTSWTNTSYASYLNEYGVNAEGFYPYTINQNTVESIENLALNNGVYTLTLKLAMTEAMYNYYTIQMSKMCSSQEFQSFVSCSLTYTIGQDGFIRSMDIDEQYKVKSSGFTATVTDDFTYIFKTSSSDDVIGDIQIDTVENIKKSLLEETPTRATNNLDLAYCKSENSEYNIYSEERRKFL